MKHKIPLEDCSSELTNIAWLQDTAKATWETSEWERKVVFVKLLDHWSSRFYYKQNEQEIRKGEEKSPYVLAAAVCSEVMLLGSLFAQGCFCNIFGERLYIFLNYLSCIFNSDLSRLEKKEEEMVAGGCLRSLAIHQSVRTEAETGVGP